MARYKHIDTGPRFFFAVDLERQLLPSSFAHAVHHLLDHDFDLAGFDTCYINGCVGVAGYPPGISTYARSGQVSFCFCFGFRFDLGLGRRRFLSFQGFSQVIHRHGVKA